MLLWGHRRPAPHRVPVASGTLTWRRLPIHTFPVPGGSAMAIWLRFMPFSPPALRRPVRAPVTLAGAATAALATSPAILMIRMPACRRHRFPSLAVPHPRRPHPREWGVPLHRSLRLARPHLRLNPSPHRRSSRRAFVHRLLRPKFPRLGMGRAPHPVPALLRPRFRRPFILRTLMIGIRSLLGLLPRLTYTNSSAFRTASISTYLGSSLAPGSTIWSQLGCHREFP